MPARRSRVHQPLAFRGLLVAVALALLASGVGRAQPLALDELQRSALAASVDAAARASDLSSALRDLERAERDPLATPLERLQAAHAVAAARAALTAAELATELATLQRVTAVLEALDAQRAADGSAEVSARQQAADEVRAHAGVITGVDLARSTSSAEAAARSARDAAASLELAWSELALLVALPAPELVAAGLQPLSGDLPALPLLEAFIAEALEGHAGLAAARRGLEVAEIRLAGADHEGTAPNVLSALRADEAAARRRTEDIAASALLQLRATYQSTSQAFGRHAAAVADEATAETTLEAQRVRAAAGELAPLALRQAELDRARAAATRRAALHAAWVAWYRMEQARRGA
jgi:hypothetical protein